MLRTPYADPLSCSFESGTTRAIDGIIYALTSWTDSQLVVGGEAIA